MKQFMDEDFLLETETAKVLYHQYAAKMPIIDYHCHISPQEIAENHRFKSITEAWLGGDHYKWRLIRSNGTPENKIIGNESDDYTKFLEYAKALPRAIGNPLYHWSHLELQRYFGITTPLTERTAKEIFEACNARLQDDDMTVQGIIKKSNVAVICTTDDPADSLEWHAKIKKDGLCSAKVVPAMRPDKVLAPQKDGFAEYITTLGDAAGIMIQSVADVKEVLKKRIAFFHEMGCRASDHALKYMFWREADEATVETIFQKALRGEVVSDAEDEMYKTAIFEVLAAEYSRLGWGMQLHYATLRDNNTPLFKQMGPDTGFDSIAEGNCAQGLVAFLDGLQTKGILPKTVIYSGNPNDNALIGTIIGCYQDAGVRGKVQQGAAWWFNDTKHGMETQLTSIADLSIVGNILGMLTDSRSFLSYARHEYYRRILCNWLGKLVENGEYPNDIETLGSIVEDICYNNVAAYFNFEV